MTGQYWGGAFIGTVLGVVLIAANLWLADRGERLGWWSYDRAAAIGFLALLAVALVLAWAL